MYSTPHVYQRRLFCGVVAMAVVLCFLVYFDRYNIVKIPIAFRHKSNLQSLQIMSKTKPPFQTTSWDNYTEADNANSSFAASNKQPTYLPHGIHYIVLYNPPWWIPIEENNDVLATTCAYTNCRLTADRKHLYSQSAIVFTVDEDRSPLPKLPPFSPRKRRPDQAWIFHWVESPVHHTGGRSVPAARTAYKTAAWRNTLNWTMTYTLDADIVFPYGILEKRTPPHRNYSLVFQTKTKMAAWLVSNCNTHSRREAYVKQLKQYGVEVDIFGGCSGGNRVDGDETRRMINTSYMFYLAFENSLCTDYITEKFFVNFNLDVITVVRGGGNYSKLLPSDAFMNTADFHSVKALADQMLLVSKSEQVFTQYLREKDHFVGSVKLTDRSRNMCELCRKLNFLETNKNMYTNLVDKIHTRTCHEPSDIE